MTAPAGLMLSAPVPLAPETFHSVMVPSGERRKARALWLAL